MRYTLQAVSLAAMGAAVSASSSVSSSCGCGAGVPSGYTGSTTEVTLSSGRVFYYHLPSGYDGTNARNVYFSFHGGTKNATEQEGLSGLSDPYFNPNGIAVYPQGEAVDGESGYFWLPNPSVSEKSPNDLDFTLDVVNWVEENLCVDQLYATGKSDGGGLTNLLACNETTAAVFTAFASVSGAYYEDKPARNCAVNRSIPFVAFHGLNDTTIPYTGKNPNSTNPATKTYDIDDWLRGWVARDNLTSGPVNTTVFTGSGVDQGPVVQSNWSTSSTQNLFVFYQEDNLGHVWPSTKPNDDCPHIQSSCPLGHYTFNATTVIVNFLNQWKLPTSSSKRSTRKTSKSCKRHVAWEA